jgi:hypothetical protein
MAVCHQVDQQHDQHRTDHGEPQPQRNVHNSLQSSTGGLAGPVGALVTGRRTPTPY